MLIFSISSLSQFQPDFQGQLMAANALFLEVFFVVDTYMINRQLGSRDNDK